MMNEFVDVTADEIKKELVQWSVSGDEYGDDDLEPGGIFYDEARAEVENALLSGGFPIVFSAQTPIAKSYIAAIFRRLTALLYIQAHRINLTADGIDPTRGAWGALRRKLSDIQNGVPFGEFSNQKTTNRTAGHFYGEPVLGLDPFRSL